MFINQFPLWGPPKSLHKVWESQVLWSLWRNLVLTS